MRLSYVTSSSYLPFMVSVYRYNTTMHATCLSFTKWTIMRTDPLSSVHNWDSSLYINTQNSSSHWLYTVVRPVQTARTLIVAGRHSQILSRGDKIWGRLGQKAAGDHQHFYFFSLVLVQLEGCNFHWIPFAICYRMHLNIWLLSNMLQKNAIEQVTTNNVSIRCIHTCPERAIQYFQQLEH